MKQNRDRILHDNKYLGFIHLNGQNLILSNTEGVCSCRSFKVCVCVYLSPVGGVTGRFNCVAIFFSSEPQNQ